MIEAPKQCWVQVPKLSLEDISRLVVNPFYISTRCKKCKGAAYYPLKCSTCLDPFHYECAVGATCCDLPVIYLEAKNSCPRCSKTVDCGPHCPDCGAQYHADCLHPFKSCCRGSSWIPKRQGVCPKCDREVTVGPQCPLCHRAYHYRCIGRGLSCCGVKLAECSRRWCNGCLKEIKIASPICQFCGKLYHRLCRKYATSCCKRSPLDELYFVPSFQSTLKIFKTRGRKMEQAIALRTRSVYNLKSDTITKGSPKQAMRIRRRTTASQTSGLDNITIVNVKTEDEEFDVSPPVLQRQDLSSPEPSCSYNGVCNQKPDDENLKCFFEFLYQMVKKFPPQLQAQVKVDLFKSVTEAEMRATNTLNHSIQNGFL